MTGCVGNIAPFPRIRANTGRYPQEPVASLHYKAMPGGGGGVLQFVPSAALGLALGGWDIGLGSSWEGAIAQKGPHKFLV